MMKPKQQMRLVRRTEERRNADESFKVVFGVKGMAPRPAGEISPFGPPSSADRYSDRWLLAKRFPSTIRICTSARRKPKRDRLPPSNYRLTMQFADGARLLRATDGGNVRSSRSIGAIDGGPN